jgi:hypothetical protein
MRTKAVMTWMLITDEVVISLFGRKLKKERLRQRDPKTGKWYWKWFFNELSIDEETGKWFWAAQWLAKKGEPANLTDESDVHEISSESTFETSRERRFKMDKEDLELTEFTDWIVTFDYNPGDALWAAHAPDPNGDSNGRFVDPFNKPSKHIIPKETLLTAF